MTWDGRERRDDKKDTMEQIRSQLINLELSVGRIETKLENLHNKVNQTNERLELEISKHSSTLYGNGHPGLTTKMENMKDIPNRVGWLEKKVWLWGGGLAALIFLMKFYL